MSEIGLTPTPLSNAKNEGSSADAQVAGLLQLLDVMPVGERQFRGIRKPGGVGRVYGGQVVAQALSAAMQTVDEARQVHSLHTYFMRPGSEDHEIDFHVEADFDGGSFSNRRVVAMQAGKAILNLVASFQIRETGFSHQMAMPDVPQPEACETFEHYYSDHKEEMPVFLKRLTLRPFPFDHRVIGVPPFCQTEPIDDIQAFWFRTKAPLVCEQSMHRTILAYASDLSVLHAAVRRHGQPVIQVASLDHAIWFHDDVHADDWLLYTTESPWAGQARGFGRGMIFDQTGRLIASVAQEGLIRPLSDIKKA
ncbi:MAG: acyl-CoA thioesterase II [Sphingobium sp.]